MKPFYIQESNNSIKGIIEHQSYKRSTMNSSSILTKDSIQIKEGVNKNTMTSDSKNKIKKKVSFKKDSELVEVIMIKSYINNERRKHEQHCECIVF